MKEGWKIKKLGYLCDIFGRIGFRGYTKQDLVYSPTDGAITLSPSNIKNGEVCYDKCSYISWEKYEESPEIMLQEGDIVLVKTASIGKCALVKHLPHPTTLNPQFVVLKNIKTNNKFLAYYLQSPWVQQKFHDFAIGAAIPTISQKKLGSLEILVPPDIIEQQRIVEILDAEFAKIDALKANAEKSLQAAKDLFQSALKQALEPKSDWIETTLAGIAELKGGKRVPKGYKLEKESTGYPYIRVADFNDNGSINMDDIHYINETVYNSIKRYIITTDDVYISIAGTIGKSGIIPKELNGANLTENACRLVFKKNNINPQYIYFCTISPAFKEQIAKLTMKAAQPKLALTRLGTVKLNIPPQKEQQDKIATILTNLDERCKALQENYRKTIALCEDLKQALLRKAFNGEL